MNLWHIQLDDGADVYSFHRPPAWTPKMAAAELVEAPTAVAAEFTDEARKRFEAEHRKPLHTVVVRGGVLERNARIA